MFILQWSCVTIPSKTTHFPGTSLNGNISLMGLLLRLGSCHWLQATFREQDNDFHCSYFWLQELTTYIRRRGCTEWEDRPDPGIKSMSLTSPASGGKFFTTSTTWEALVSSVGPSKAFQPGH